MGRKLEANSKGGDFEKRELIPTGTYMGVVVGVCDIGTQPPMPGSTFAAQRKVVITWELVDPDEEEKVVGLMSNFYTLSLNTKANLRADLGKMLGRTFQDGETYDLEELLEHQCQVQVVHKTSKDSEGKETVRDRIGSLMPRHKRDPKITPQNPVYYFELPDDAEKCEVPAEVPEWLRKKIEQSEEWQGRKRRTEQPEPTPPTQPAQPARQPQRQAPQQPAQPTQQRQPAQHTRARVTPQGEVIPMHTGDDDIPY